MGLWILRVVFLLFAIGAGWSFVTLGGDIPASERQGTFFVILLLAVTVISVDILIPRKRIEIITCVYFGIFVGLFLTYGLSTVLDPLMLDENLEPTIHRLHREVDLEYFYYNNTGDGDAASDD